MKSLRFMLPAVLALLATMAFAQSDAQKSADAQKAFAELKTLAGDWQGHFTVDPPQPDANGLAHISLRVTSRGNAMVHEMQEAGTPLDATKYDHPVTMLYVDDARLYLVHYCDAGNRPRMVGTLSPDGKKVEFSFLDLSGGNQYGHMVHAVFTAIDAHHHTEDWIYLMPGDKQMRAHIDLQRVK